MEYSLTYNACAPKDLINSNFSGDLNSVQFSRSVVSDSLRPHEPQHTRPPCPSPTPGVHPNPCPLSRWCHPTISSSVVPCSSCLQSFPASGSFLITRWPHNSSPRFLPKLVETRYLNRYLYTRVHCSIIHRCWKVDGSFSFSSQPMPNPALTVASLLKSCLYSNTGVLTHFSSRLNLSYDQKSDLFTHFFSIPSLLAIIDLFYEFGFLFQIPYISEIIWYFLSLTYLA